MGFIGEGWILHTDQRDLLIKGQLLLHDLLIYIIISIDMSIDTAQFFCGG